MTRCRQYHKRNLQSFLQNNLQHLALSGILVMTDELHAASGVVGCDIGGQKKTMDMEHSPSSFGALLRYYRQAARWTQKELAERDGIRSATWNAGPSTSHVRILSGCSLVGSNFPKSKKPIGAYEALLAERGISLVDRDAPLRFEALLQEMRLAGIQPRAANAVASFRAATASEMLAILPTSESRPQEAQAGKQISMPEHRSLDASASTGKRSFSEHPLPATHQEEQGINVFSHPWTLVTEALQSMLAEIGRASCRERV